MSFRLKPPSGLTRSVCKPRSRRKSRNLRKFQSCPKRLPLGFWLLLRSIEIPLSVPHRRASRPLPRASLRALRTYRISRISRIFRVFKIFRIHQLLKIKTLWDTSPACRRDTIQSDAAQQRPSCNQPPPSSRTLPRKSHHKCKFQRYLRSAPPFETSLSSQPQAPLPQLFRNLKAQMSILSHTHTTRIYRALNRLSLFPIRKTTLHLIRKSSSGVPCRFKSVSCPTRSQKNSKTSYRNGHYKEITSYGKMWSHARK